MLKTTLRPMMTGALALALCAAVALPAAADDGEKKVHVKKIHLKCDGEDCEHDGEHRKFFLGEGGDLHELMGDDVKWVEAGEHGIHVMGGSGTFLGVQLTDLTDELRIHFGVPEGEGVMVAKVVDGSPAAIAGVKVGDVVTRVDGEVVDSGGSLGQLIRQREEGETVALELYREGRLQTLSPTLAKSEAPRIRAFKMGDPAGVGGVMGGMKKVMVRCDGEGGEEDCEVTVAHGDDIDAGDFDCGAEECRVEVRCEESGCECTVNGDAIDCNEIPGFAERHGG